MFIFLDQLVISLAQYETKKLPSAFQEGSFVYTREDALSLDDLTSK